jgi:ATP phosphoribosyltransferase
MLKIALPKGSLESQTMKLFEEADLQVSKESRGYNPKINDPRVGKVKILRPQEIPTFVAEGYFDLGISGQDCIREAGADVVEITPLSYSKVSDRPIQMVIAVSEDSTAEKPEDIAAGSRISTEYPKLTKKYFEGLNIPVNVFFSYGATEAKIPELMDAVVDLTETGETLRKNRLKIIGSIMTSTTMLIANKDAWNDKRKRKAIEEIKTLLLGVMEARGRVLLSMNVPEDNLDDVINTLPAMKKPTVSKLYKIDYYEITTVVDKKNVNILIPELKNKGAEDILELPIAKIVR